MKIYEPFIWLSVHVGVYIMFCLCCLLPYNLPSHLHFDGHTVVVSQDARSGLTGVPQQRALSCFKLPSLSLCKSSGATHFAPLVSTGFFSRNSAIHIRLQSHWNGLLAKCLWKRFGDNHYVSTCSLKKHAAKKLQQLINSQGISIPRLTRWELENSQSQYKK